MTAKVVGLDTAKHVFQVHGADQSGRTVVREAQIPSGAEGDGAQLRGRIYACSLFSERRQHESCKTGRVHMPRLFQPVITEDFNPFRDLFRRLGV
jgi:hypothetical protein